MINQGPFDLTLGVPISLVDPAIGNGSVLLQIDNWSAYVLEVTVGPNANVWLNPFTAQTFPLADGSLVTVTPITNWSGAAATQFGITWLLQGEDAPNPNGSLTQPIEISPSQVIQSPTTYTGGSTTTVTLAVDEPVHALGLMLDVGASAGTFEGILFSISGGVSGAVLYEQNPLANQNNPGLRPGSFFVIPIDGAIDSTVVFQITGPAGSSTVWSCVGITDSLPPFVPEVIPGNVASGAFPSDGNLLPSLTGSGRHYVLWSVMLMSGSTAALVVNGASYPAGLILAVDAMTAVQTFPTGLVCSQLDVANVGGTTEAVATYTYA
jgi:hypothetical protein